LGEQEQSSSVLELEQSTGSAEVGGFLLAPHLSQALGMHPSEMLFRSMFYGTPQASRISDLITELLIEHEDLLCRVMGEGTSSILLGGGACSIALVDSSAATIQALIDSIEAPLSVVVPSEAVEGVGTVTNGQALGVPEVVAVAGVGDATYEQATSAPEQSNRYSCVGFVLPPDLALKLGMYPGQVLCRSMFYDTPQSDIVLDVVGQISEAQECLLRDQELERSGVVDQGVSRVGYGNTDALIAANEELLQALMDSIESPLLTAVPPVIAVSSSSEEMSDEVERDRSIEVENERVLEIAREEMAEMERERLRVIAEIEARKREKDHVKVENVEREIQGRIDAREERARRVEIDVQERREAREAREAKARRIEQEMRGEDIEEERELVSRLEEELAKARAERLARAEIALRAEQEAKAEKEREKEREREKESRERERESRERERKKEKEREKERKKAEKDRERAEKEQRGRRRKE
ncbi:hypothetical protein, partial [Candidatus Ichthyocystis sparus]|uniref:hypothetical protein n=1 Tax=Candidatus Ichthyocystis sparus TaxID=1561004 RepID=UPI003F6BB6F8